MVRGYRAPPKDVVECGPEQILDQVVGVAGRVARVSGRSVELCRHCRRLRGWVPQRQLRTTRVRPTHHIPLVPLLVGTRRSNRPARGTVDRLGSHATRPHHRPRRMVARLLRPHHERPMQRRRTLPGLLRHPTPNTTQPAAQPPTPRPVPLTPESRLQADHAESLPANTTPHTTQRATA